MTRKYPRSSRPSAIFFVIASGLLGGRTMGRGLVAEDEFRFGALGPEDGLVVLDADGGGVGLGGEAGEVGPALRFGLAFRGFELGSGDADVAREEGDPGALFVAELVDADLAPVEPDEEGAADAHEGEEGEAEQEVAVHGGKDTGFAIRNPAMPNAGRGEA